MDVKNVILSPMDLIKAGHAISKTATTSRTKALKTLICGDKTLTVWCIMECNLNL